MTSGDTEAVCSCVFRQSRWACSPARNDKDMPVTCSMRLTLLMPLRSVLLLFATGWLACQPVRGDLVVGDLIVGDFIVEQGETLSPSIPLDGRVVNHGHIFGSTTQPVVFGPGALVSGSGHFTETLNYGTFAPGNSPGVTTGTNQAFAGTVEIELGGTTPGFGSGKHDQINDNGAILIVGFPTLSLISFESFIPSAGDEFTILTWDEGLVGDFGTVELDPAFVSAGIEFEQVVTNRLGAGDLTLRAVAVPEVGGFLQGLGVVLLLVCIKPFSKKNRPHLSNIIDNLFRQLTKRGQ